MGVCVGSCSKVEGEVGGVGEGDPGVEFHRFKAETEQYEWTKFYDIEECGCFFDIDSGEGNKGHEEVEEEHSWARPNIRP